MSAFKGTKGPWLARPDWEGSAWEVVKARTPGGDFDDGPVWFVADCHDSAEGAAAEDNARLIAAAPELLSSLEFAVKLLTGLPHVGGTAQLEHMRSVIAKATGGAA